MTSLPIPPPPLTPEQVRQYVKSHYALGLPAGSVRALLALIIFGGLWAIMWLRPDEEVPRYLRDLMFIILGHYFAARRPIPADVGPAPLYLPAGSVRTLMLLGFAVLTGTLIHTHRMIVRETHPAHLSQAGVTLILVGGFMLGVLMSRLSGKSVSRWFEDLRAVVSLLAGVLLVLMVLGFVQLPDGPAMQALHKWAAHFRVEDILAAIVGFYFGSRS